MTRASLAAPLRGRLLCGAGAHSPYLPSQVSTSPSQCIARFSYFCVHSAKVVPATLMVPGDRLVTVGSAIGAELCLDQDMDGLSTVVVRVAMCHSYVSIMYE
jgi:hypothetical protein